MRLTSFGLKGILAYQGTEARVDATALPAGLIAITGENGHGKTTLLETPLAAAFRSFPSRSDKELADYTFTSDGYLEVTFDLDGRGQYRARVNVDGPRRKSSATLEFIGADGRRKPLNDGKVSTFAGAIKALLPPPELFLASVFASQNLKGSFITLSNAERKELFAMLLGLAQLADMADRAKKAEKAAADALIPLKSARAILARDAAPEIADELQQLANELQAAGGTLEADRVVLERELRTIERFIEERQEAAAQHAAARARVDALELDLRGLAIERTNTAAALSTLTTDVGTETAGIERAAESAIHTIDAQRVDASAYQAELRRIQEAHDAAIVDPQARLAKNRSLLEQQGAVRAAAERVARATEALRLVRDQEPPYRDQLATAQRRERVLSDALTAIAEQERELGRARTAASLIQSVPFGDECAPCQFMTDAIAAKTRIPGLEEAVASRAATEAERAGVLKTIETTERLLESLTQQAAVYQAVITEDTPLAKAAEQLAGAEERIAGYEARLAELAADADRQREQAAAREADRAEDLARRREDRQQQLTQDLAALAQRAQTRRDELTAKLRQLDTAIAERSATLDQLRPQLEATKDAAEQAAGQKALLQLKQQAWTRCEAALASVKTRREELERRRALYAGRRAELEATDAQIAAITLHQIEWQVLARACSRDGLQTIEIDEAGPTVSAYTNDILRACYGPRFSVEIVTQEDKKSKGKDGSTTRETFEVKVWDAERGGPARDISDLSGGEKVIVDEALKSAIAILVNERNQFRIRTCWRDETTGPLSAENRPRYLAMLRRVHELGGFHHTYFVTHDAETALQADAQLVVDNGQVTVALPPYGRRIAA